MIITVLNSVHTILYRAQLDALNEFELYCCCHFGTFFCPVGLVTLVAVVFVEAFTVIELCYVSAFVIVILALPAERSLEKQFQTLP